MRPILFDFGPLVLYSYGAMLALGFLVAAVLAARCARRQGMPSGKIFDLALFILITGIAGSRLLYVILNWPDFSERLLKIFFLNQGGLVLYGGFAAAVPASLWFIKRNALPLYETLDLVSPYVFLAQSIGRIGCFLNGCCYGRPTDFFLGVYSARQGAIVHPVQIYSSFALLCMFSILKYRYKKIKFQGEIFFSYLALYSFFRFFIEFLRGDSGPAAFGLSLFQYISVVLFAASLVLYLAGKRRSWKNTPIP